VRFRAPLWLMMTAGTTAVIMLANYFKKLNKTKEPIFTAFVAEK
jgi:hypothetical protein